jgi:hypothetical protein
MKQDNPFAKLGALDQKLYQDTAPKPQSPAGQFSGNPEFKNSSNLETQKSGLPEIQKSRIPENQTTSKPGKREFFTKATYRLCDEALDAIEDAKKVLKRQYGLKVNLEEIVETAVLSAYKDLADNKEKSTLVTKYSGNPENQKT